MILVVRALAREESAAPAVRQRALHEAHDVAGAANPIGYVEDAGRVEQQPGHARLILEHLLGVRAGPVASGRVTKHAAVDIVHHRAREECGQRAAHDVSECILTRRDIAGEREPQGGEVQKLAVPAKPAVLGVVLAEDLVRHPLRGRGIGLVPIRRRFVTPCRRGSGGACHQFVISLTKGVCGVAKHAQHQIGRDIRAARQDLAGWCEQCRCRPSIQVVAIVDVRPSIRIHLDRDRPLHDGRDDVGACVRRLLHHGTSMTPRCTDVQQHGTPLVGRALECFSAPLLPRHRGSLRMIV